MPYKRNSKVQAEVRSEALQKNSLKVRNEALKLKSKPYKKFPRSKLEVEEPKKRKNETSVDVS